MLNLGGRQSALKRSWESKRHRGETLLYPMKFRGWRKGAASAEEGEIIIGFGERKKGRKHCFRTVLLRTRGQPDILKHKTRM